MIEDGVTKCLASRQTRQAGGLRSHFNCPLRLDQNAARVRATRLRSGEPRCVRQNSDAFWFGGFFCLNMPSH